MGAKSRNLIWGPCYVPEPNQQSKGAGKSDLTFKVVQPKADRTNNKSDGNKR